VTIPNCGHMPEMEKPAEFAELVISSATEPDVAFAGSRPGHSDFHREAVPLAWHRAPTAIRQVV
jgi:hypothetical protein